MSSKEGNRQQPSSEGCQRLSCNGACCWNGEYFFYSLLLFTILYLPGLTLLNIPYFNIMEFSYAYGPARNKELESLHSYGSLQTQDILWSYNFMILWRSQYSVSVYLTEWWGTEELCYHCNLQPQACTGRWVEVSLKMYPAMAISKSHKAFPRIPTYSMPSPLGCLAPKLFIFDRLSLCFSIPTAFMSAIGFWSWVDNANGS